MAYGKPAESAAYRKLKADVSAGVAAPLYVFYGEESYLKEYYRDKLAALADGGFADFNLIRLEGTGLSRQALTEAIDSLPIGSEKKVVIVRDYNLMRPTGDLKDSLGEIISDLPPYICLIFYYETLEFKADKRLNIYKTLDKHGQIVNFEKASAADLIPWIKRRFQALDKRIDTSECEYLIFLCGALMTNLITEIEKIAAGTPSSQIKREHIEALASRVLEAEIFSLTDSMVKNDFTKAISLLRDLFAAKNEPVVVLSAITRQMQRLYAARLVIEERQGDEYLVKLCGFRSAYPATLLLRAAGGIKLDYLRRAQQLCADADREIKSNLPDAQRSVELLLLKLAEGAKSA